MSVGYDINKALSRDSRFREQEDILFMALKRAEVPAVFYLSCGKIITGIVQTRYAKFLNISDGNHDHYVPIKAVEAVIVESDFTLDLDEGNNEE